MKSDSRIIDSQYYKAALFDMDGVVTRTADMHAAAWKIIFDEFLEEQFGAGGFVPFDLKADYITYVDGKPRQKGIRDFLASRGLPVAWDDPDEEPAAGMMAALGSRKKQVFSQMIGKQGVLVYQSTIRLIHDLRKLGMKTAIVSSSKNCLQIIRTADIESLFDVRVDGVVSENLGLSGKPDPDIFYEAALRMGIDVRRCVLVEDAVSGVAAAKKAGFGMIIGVNRNDNADQLKQTGAHVVVDDLEEIKAGIPVQELPGAVGAVSEIIRQADAREILVFLDADILQVCIEKKRPDVMEGLSALSDRRIVIVMSRKKDTVFEQSLTGKGVYWVSCFDQSIKGADGSLIKINAPEPDGWTGTAWVLEALNLSSRSIFPILIGKGFNNEKDMSLIRQSGLLIAAGTGLSSPAASYGLFSPDRIVCFFNALTVAIDKGTGWEQVFNCLDPQDEGRRETLCALGNGFFVTRGTAPEAEADRIHYPGTYLAGGYNRLKSKIGAVTVENEDLVNLPNWLSLKFRIKGQEWFNPGETKVLFFKQVLDMKRGILRRTIRFRDESGRETMVSQSTIVHGELMHLAALETRITPLNWSGEIQLCSALDGKVTNAGVQRYRELRNAHLDYVTAEHINENAMALKVRTNGSCLDIAMGALTTFLLNDRVLTPQSIAVDKPDKYIARKYDIPVQKGDDFVVEKRISIYTSRDPGIYECFDEAKQALLDPLPDFKGLLKAHVTAWEMLWREFDFRLTLDDPQTQRHTQKIVRMYIFHLLQSSSFHSLDIDVGMPARGWHGEGYRGHIFWDEMIIFPFLNYRAPRITKTLLMYRYRRLNAARKAAQKAGYKGAMYPWQSGSNGREETQQMHLNPDSGRWIKDHTYLQRHVNNAIVYNIWQYFQITNDIQFLSFYGGEIIIEIARFWASLATYNIALDRYEILGVMGPDEYHDAYPSSKHPGLNNNSYTNMMVMFVMNQALNLKHVLPRLDWESLCRKLKIRESELSKWRHMSRRMKLVFHRDGILSQFEGYENLQEFDWKKYRKNYSDIRRLDRILEKEGDSPNKYKLCKQPDVLMLFYLFSAETLRKMFKQLGYPLRKNFIRKNINYYLKRTTNGSSLALVIHAWIEARQARKRSWSFLIQALETDMFEDRTGSIREGIHLAAMAGCIDIFQRGYAGLEIRSDILVLNPMLPASINQVRFHIRYRKHWLDIEITQETVVVRDLTKRATPFTLMIKEEIIKLYPGHTAVVEI